MHTLITYSKNFIHLNVRILCHLYFIRYKTMFYMYNTITILRPIKIQVPRYEIIETYKWKHTKIQFNFYWTDWPLLNCKEQSHVQNNYATHTNFTIPPTDIISAWFLFSASPTDPTTGFITLLNSSSSICFIQMEYLQKY